MNRERYLLPCSMRTIWTSERFLPRMDHVVPLEVCLIIELFATFHNWTLVVHS